MILLSKKVPNSEEYSQSGEVVTINNPRGDLQLKNIDIDGKSEQATTILPDGYTQVDYIESSGTQYIITDVLSTEATRYETVVSYTDVTNRGLMGASGGVYFGVVNGKFQIGHNGTDTSNITASTDTWYNIAFSNSGNNYTMTVNGETGTNTKTTSYGNIGIFKLGTSGSSTNTSKAKIKIFKVYNNDVLNLNLVPCYRNSDSVVGMYDTVNNTFYTNSGTGNFTVGNTPVLPNPDYKIDIKTITGDISIKGVTIALGSTEICSITNFSKTSTVKDISTLNIKTGDLTKTNKIKKRLFNGTENWSLHSINSYGIANYQLTISDTYSTGQEYQYIMCDKLKQQSTLIANTQTEGILLNDQHTFFIRINSSRANTVADFKTWLSNNPLTVYYRLATPVTETIGTLTQEQLNAFKMTIGENVYQLSSDLGTSNLTITYEDYFDYFDFDKILINGYNIDEQPNIISKKQYANGRRKKIQTEYTDVVIKVNLGCFDGDTLSTYLNKLQDGEYQYYSLKDKQKKNANFIVTLPSQKVQSSANEIIVDDFEAILEKSSDVE